MADMRKVFLGILKRYGHDVFLQRRTGETSGSQPRPIYATNLEKYTCRRMVSKSDLLADSADEVLEGITNSIDMVFYFMHMANPKEGDLIHEPDPRYNLSWRVDSAYPMRGKGGQIIYWVAGVTRNEPN